LQVVQRGGNDERAVRRARERWVVKIISFSEYTRTGQWVSDFAYRAAGCEYATVFGGAAAKRPR